jgi:hypothetical protein
MPASDSPISSEKPSAPPATVHSVRRWPCSAPWVRTRKLFGPGVIDRPMAAIA